ncbi:MAG: hypothetical protein FJ088_11140, partial [Deltaproteobacteria bacterium]|nr:hypothetical protein [Deltaproteobacteria bacterium]
PVNEDGSDLRQETFGFGIDLDPSFLSDGRMIFTSMRGIGLYNGASIAALGKDGYFPLFGENSKYTIFAYPSELPDGRIAVILMDTANRWEGGAVGLIDLSLGADIESKLSNSAAVKDYIKPLVQASAATVSYKDQSPQGFFREISPLPDGRLLVSYSKKTMNLKMDAPEPDTAIYFAEIIQNEETEKPSLKLIEPALADAEGMNDSDPVGIFARKKPEILEKPDGTEKVLKIPDAAMFQSILMNNAPVKRSDLLREDIEFVRVISQLPPALEEHEPLLNPLNTKKAKNNDPFSTLISNGIFKKRLILGTAPVEKDGSVNIRIKSGMPVTFQFLNAEGFAVGEEIGRWFYFTGGGEVSFGVKRENYELECASCHGTLDGSKKETGVFPDDAVNYESSAGSKEAFELTEARGVDFKTRIQTLMMLKCAYGGCHDNAGKSGGLDLTESGDGGYNGMYSNGYENLMVLGEGSGIELEEKPWLVNGSPWKKAYVDERNARAIRSYLMEKILNEELDAPKGLSGGQCKANEIDDQEKELFKDWIDLGATFLGL